MMQGLQLSLPRRLLFVRNTLLISLLLISLFTFPLWTAYREFPLSPAWYWTHAEPWLHLLLYLLLLLAWIFALVSRFQRLFILLSLLLSLGLVCTDLNRLQTWFYLFNAMLLLLLFYNGRVDNPNTYASFYVMLQLMLASVYFYAGLHLLNPDFVSESLVPLMHPLRALCSERQFSFLTRIGIVLPYLYIFSGLGLMIEGLRFFAMCFAGLLHLGLLILLFPAIDGNDYGLWLSNLTFLILLLLLFSGRTQQRYFSALSLLQKPGFYPFLLLFLLLPLLNRRGLWPDTLSANLRSGNTLEARISIGERSYLSLPAEIKACCTRENFGYLLDYRKWSEAVCHAACVPDERVFRSINAYLLRLNGNEADEVSVLVLQRNKFF